MYNFLLFFRLVIGASYILGSFFVDLSFPILTFIHLFWIHWTRWTFESDWFSMVQIFADASLMIFAQNHILFPAKENGSVKQKQSDFNF